MPRFDYNPAEVQAGFPVYPKDSYEVLLGEAKSFFKKGEKGENWGVRFTGKIVEGPKKGGKFMINCYMHTEDSQSMSKQVQMAALGFTKKQEKEFDAAHGTDDWSYNTDDGSCGDGWHKMEKQVVIYDLDVKMGENGEEQQKTVGVRPFSV